MPQESGDLLDPAAVARLGRLELVAHTLVEGFIKGLHLSAAKGSSTEFAEHRPYVAGDEIRHIDWRTYGRTDRFYLKEYDDETNVRATLLLDISASMGFASGSLSKLRYAVCLAAALGYLLMRQRDAVGLVLAGASISRHIPPKATPQHLRGVFSSLASAAPAGPTGIAEAVHRLADSSRSGGFLIVLSDLIEDPRSVLGGLAHLRRRHADAIIFHVMDPAEEEFPFGGWTVFHDVESPGVRLRLDARQVRDTYRENLREHLEVLQKGCAAAGIDYHRMTTRTPFELALARYLDARARRER